MHGARLRVAVALLVEARARCAAVRGKHGNRDSHLTNATLVAVLTQCTEVPDEV